MTRSPDGPIRDHPMRKLLICVRHPFDQWNAPTWFSERLRKEFPQIETVHLPDYKRVDEEIVDAEIVVAWSIRTEQALAAALAVQETLVKEVHHRVKNNLQIISSLLNMQAELCEPEQQAVLRDSQLRVQSMALIHDRL